MRVIFVISSIISLFIVSCEKYEYEHHLFSNPSCKLCSFAESLEGTYKGIAVGVSVPPALSSFPHKDSVTMTVSQVFLNQNTFEDSTYMYFAVSFKYHSLPEIKWDTVQIIDTTGRTQNKEYLSFVNVNPHENYAANSNYIKIKPDRLIMAVDGPTGTGTATILYHGSILYKQ